MTPQFSICHTTARPNGWRKSYDLWIERAAFPENVEYVLCVDERWGFPAPFTPGNDPNAKDGECFCFDCWLGNDRSLHGAGENTLNRLVWNTGRKCMVDGYAEAARASTGAILIMNSDDMEPPQRWDEALTSAVVTVRRKAVGLTHLQCPAIRDEFKPRDLNGLTDDFAVHVLTGYFDAPQASGIQILSRARYERLGYVFYPEYESLFADDDFLQHAYHDGVVIDARHLTFPHRHAQPAEWDEVYAHQNRGEASDLGRRLLQRRVACGFQVLSRPPMKSRSAEPNG